MKPKIIIGVLVMVAALIYLIFSGLQGSAAYYVTIAELRSRPELADGKGIRIHGMVDPATIQWHAAEIELYFDLYDEGDSLRVFYQGIKPDQLANAQQVVMEGRLRPDGVFHASKIMLKCPSKYEVKTESKAAAL